MATFLSFHAIDRRVRMRSNPSIELTPNSQLRCLSVVAHVKR